MSALSSVTSTKGSRLDEAGEGTAARSRFSRLSRTAGISGTSSSSTVTMSAMLAPPRGKVIVEVDNLFDQCQTDPGPLVAARRASFHLSEAVKDPFQLIVRDADPVVFDLQLDRVFIRAQPHPHLPLLWIAELEGVGEQVIEDLLHLERVGCNRDRLLHPSGMDTAPCTRVKVGRDAPDDGSEIDASLLQFRAPALKLGQVQQFVDEKQEPGRIPQARLNQLPALRGWRKLEESLVRAQAERQRGAELMTDIGEKLRLQPIQFQELLVGGLQF